MNFGELVVLVKTNCSTIEGFLWKQTLIDVFLFFFFALDR